MKAILLQAVALSALTAIASAQVPAGGEFQVNTFTLYEQRFSRTSMEPDGDFVVVWMSRRQVGPDWGVFGQRFAASGAPRGGELQLNSYTLGAEGAPAVAVGSSGDFVVVWHSQALTPLYEIVGRRYDALGGALGLDFLVNTYTTGSQALPDVGRASDGRFVVTWMSANVDGSSYGIAARRFDASGNPSGSEFVVNTYTTGSQRYASVGVEANGNFVVVWQDYLGNRDGSGSALFGQRYDASGNRLGSEFQVNAYTTGNQAFASISMSPAGGFVVVWRGPGDGSLTGVFSRMFDASGNAVGNDFIVNTYTTNYQSVGPQAVAHDADGNFVVTWSGASSVDDRDVLAQRFSASGARRGGEFRVNTFTTANQAHSSVASNSLGNFVVTWESNNQDGSNYGVFAQRFGGLQPTGLAVDATATPTANGNGVFDPGETVAVSPAWRNVSDATQSFGGAASSFTGPGTPGDPVYTIADGSATYGSVANGANASCTSTGDCYALGTTMPTARPAPHWDATVREDITPALYGQSKEWTLHIGDSFSDVPNSSGSYRFIETLLHRDVTGGCAFMAYCPSAGTTREQMAVFVLVAKEGTGYFPPACTTPIYNDVPTTSPFCRWIEELARRGVVSGCGSGNYCPTASVTREQMAVFVLRTLDPLLSPPACTTPIYNDVPASSGFCRWIEELTRRAVVAGCGGGNYCPTAAVTREQMGVFITVTFGLTLYGP